MAERADQLSRERDRGDAPSNDGSRLGRAVRSRLGEAVHSRLFSVRAFLASLAVLVAGLLVGGAMLEDVGGIAGMLAAGFVLGLGGGRPVEVAAAGGIVAAFSLLLSMPVLSLVLGFAGPVAVVGAGSGLLVAGIGAYLGGDLRDGLTREL